MKNKSILLAILIFITSFLHGQEVQVNASAPNVVAVGQQFQLTFSTTEKATHISMPQISDFSVRGGPQTGYSSSTQFINGKHTQTQNYSYTYILQAVKEGEFTIQGAVLTINGKNIRSNNVTIKVQGGGQQQSQGNTGRGQQQSQAFDSKDFFVKASVSNTNPFVEEQVVVNYKLYIGPQARGYQANIKKLPTTTGFWTYELSDRTKEANQYTETLNGKKYTVIDLYSLAAFPQKSGKLVISPLEIDMIVQIVTQQQRSNDPFEILFGDPFFGGGRAQNIELSPVSNSITMQVKDLPAGKPADFSGVVGNFAIQSKLSREKLETNDAANFTITVTGTGNLQHIEAPQIAFPPDFDVHDPNVVDNIKTSSSGVSGSRSFEYVLIPRNAGDYTIPSASFSYYDKAKGKYFTLHTPEYDLQVEKGKDADQGGYYTSVNKKNVQITGNDIRYIKTHDSDLQLKENSFFPSPLYWFLLLLPPVLFVFFVFLLKKQIENKKDIAKQKHKKASKQSRKRLKKAEKYLKAGDNQAFYVEISQALWGYISDKFHIPLANLSLETAREELYKKNLKEELIDEFLNTLNECEYARFAPHSDMTPEKMYEKASHFITKMEQKLRKS